MNSEIINRLMKLPCKHHNPATREQLARASLELSCELPHEVACLYEGYNGNEKDPYHGMRLLPIAELKLFHNLSRERGWADLGIRLFWTDNHSSFAGVYVAGPLKDKVCLLKVDEPDPSPAYRSVVSFLKTMLDTCYEIDSEQGWPTMHRDYPLTDGESTDGNHIADSNIALLFHEQFLRYRGKWSQHITKHIWNPRALTQNKELGEISRTDGLYLATTFMKLTSVDKTADMVPLLLDKDFAIQDTAAEIIGLHKFEPAVDDLARLAEQGNLPSIRALGRIGSRMALDSLVRISKSLDKGFLAEIAGALEDCGSEIKCDADNESLSVRLPDSRSWIQIF
jgi:hypothetical protein